MKLEHFLQLVLQQDIEANVKFSPFRRILSKNCKAKTTAYKYEQCMLIDDYDNDVIT